jgi:microsomal dipeptidase-like Zn-dependent dipeptidase
VGRILRLVLWMVLGLAALVALALVLLPSQLDARLNRVIRHERATPSARARALHESLVVMDWHADSLLWNRDLRVRNSVGHVDLPRLVEGGVAIQMFTAVTRSPARVDYEASPGRGPDLNTAQALLQLWPPATWWSLEARALFQARKLRRWAGAAPETLTLLRSAADLEDFLRERGADPGRVAALLGTEGAHCLEGDLSAVDRLFEAGYRMIGLTHFFDNELGGSLHGVSRAGLTDFGRQVVDRAEALEMIIDLAHASPRMVEEVLARTTRPPVVSHTGVKGNCDHVRNLSDAQAKAIAAKGGLIGIGFWDAAVCDPSPRGIARAIRYTADLAGVEHLALGSDYDGTIEAPFDVSELAVLTEALLAEGFSEREIAAIMGGNSVALLRANLPRR